MRNGGNAMNLKKMLLVAATATLAIAAMAQGGGQGRRGFMQNFNDPYMLLSREDVQKDLAITDDQKTKITDATEKANQKRQEAMQAARDSAGGDFQAVMKAMQPINEKLTAENWSNVGSVISADQTKRLKEISIQMQGNSVVMTNKDVQKDLSVTDEQKTKFTDLQAKQQTAMQELFQKMRDGEVDRSQMPEIMAKNRKVMEDEINKVLTETQKSKLKDMAGKPFTRIDPPPPGGGR